jgi:hypothetical protein
MPNTTYTFKPRRFGAPVTLTSSAEGVESVDGKSSALVAWTNIERIELWLHSSVTDHPEHRCLVSVRGAKALLICSASRRGLLRSVPQDREYRRFVLALHDGVLMHGSHVSFRGGVSVARYALNLSILVLLAGSLSVAAFSGFFRFVHSPMGTWFLFALASTATWSWLRRNRPKSYDPRAIPPGLLPPESSAPEPDVTDAA